SVRGEMAVAEKGDNHNAPGYIFYGQHNAWSSAITPVLGDLSGPGSAGGVDFGNAMMVGAGGNRIVCDSLAWFSINFLWIHNPLTNSNTNCYGYQSIPR